MTTDSFIMSAIAVFVDWVGLVKVVSVQTPADD